MSAGLKFTLGSYVLTITRFGSFPGVYPRNTVNWVTVSHSALGSTSLRGSSYRPKYIWQFEARLDSDQLDTWQRMLALYLNSPATPITLEDYTLEFEETGTRTRALATGASEDSDGTTVKYHAKFEVFPTQYPSLTELSGSEEILDFQFTEADIIAA